MPEILSFPTRTENTPSKVPSPMPLSVRHLAFQAGHTSILKGVDLDLKTDALTVLMGPNGAGKSVLLRLLHGLLAPSFGEVRWNGLPLDKSLRRQQALVFQKPVLLRRSVKANLNFALGLRPVANRAAKLAQALANSGLEHLAKRQARVLSGGEQQRLALARALILDPKVLMLDEPTANLDPASTLVIEQAIASARRRGVKVILVTHDQHQARRLGEEVVFLHDGKITEHNDAESFFDSPKSAAANAYLSGDILV
ncbi:ATP-binding cassette domain-containing protein [Labrenzia sp. CE80]|uniref:ATP-binding cassette domain-containing protein n=1 Tax=Labrenzia sp. CE80 TaxID=1788986 RepID=UPI001878E365|nr:ATP-binding cassette domain-containing protein [Labrenzia sp. CE80]